MLPGRRVPLIFKMELVPLGTFLVALIAHRLTFLECFYFYLASVCLEDLFTFSSVCSYVITNQISVDKSRVTVFSRWLRMIKWFTFHI